MAAVLDRGVLAGDSLEAARRLLGMRLVREDESGRRAGRIVEVEAYVGPEDRASHARFGPTARNRVMFGPPGIAYMYLVYGMHHCLNVVTERAGRPAALLVRAVTPLDGLAEMRASRLAAFVAGRRPTAAGFAAERGRIAALDASRLASGPGLVAAAFGLDRTWTGVDLCDPGSTLRLEAPGADDAGREEPSGVIATPRIGVDHAGEPWVSRPWRFFLAGERSVSNGRSGALGGPGVPRVAARH